MRLIQPLDVDIPVSQWLQRQRRPWLDRLMVAVSAFGYNPLNWMTLLAAAALAAWAIGWLASAFVFLASAAGGLGNYAIKRLVGRARPGAELIEVFVAHEDFSFPSGHVQTYTTLFGFCAFLLWRLEPSLPRTLLLAAALLLVLLVGPSRVYVGAHWSSDVLAAYLAGALTLWLVTRFYLWALLHL